MRQSTGNRLSIGSLFSLIFYLFVSPAITQAAPPPATVVVSVDKNMQGDPYLNATQMKTIIDKLQSIADTDLGKGELNFVNKDNYTGEGDRSIRIGGGDYKYFGDTGDGKNTHVDLGTFIVQDKVQHDKDGTNPFQGDALLNAIAETGFHEITHTYGGDDNEKTPIDLMTTGDAIPNPVRAKDDRHLNDADKKKVIDNIKSIGSNPHGAHKNDVASFDSGISGGVNDDANFVNASLLVTGGLAGSFAVGWMIDDGVGGQAFFTKYLPAYPDDMMTLWTGYPAQFAIRGLPGTPWENDIFLADDYALIITSDSVFNPTYGLTVYRNLEIAWDVNHDGQNDVTMSLRTSSLDPATTSGFDVVSVPEPATIVLLAMGGMALILRKGTWRSRC